MIVSSGAREIKTRRKRGRGGCDGLIDGAVLSSVVNLSNWYKIDAENHSCCCGAKETQERAGVLSVGWW
jgi:hypothetical protein